MYINFGLMNYHVNVMLLHSVCMGVRFAWGYGQSDTLSLLYTLDIMI